MGRKLIYQNRVGAYVYALKIDGVIRYIGKGRRYRILEHTRIARDIIQRRANGEKVRANRVYNKLAKAIVIGSCIEPFVIIGGLSDADAFERERVEIANAPPGQLWNLKEGGASGDPEFMRALWANPEHRKRFSTAIGEGKRKPHNREIARKATQQLWDDPEYRAEQVAREKALWADPEYRAKRITILQKVWADPVRNAKKIALVKSQWTEERKRKQSENRRARWADPEFKAKASASIKASWAKRKLEKLNG